MSSALVLAALFAAAAPGATPAPGPGAAPPGGRPPAERRGIRDTTVVPEPDVAHPSAAPVAVPPPEEEGTAWFGIPVVFWSPETRLGFGGTGGVHHRLEGAPRASSAFLTGVYTIEEQGSLDLAGELYLGGGALFTGRARLVIFPDRFYGLGTHAHETHEERFTRRYAEAYGAFELPVLRGLRAGARFDARREAIVDVEADGALASGAVAGADGFWAVGLGPSVTWDTRDSAFWPTRGTFAQGMALLYPGTGGRAPFRRAGIEIRRFVPLGARPVLGLAGAIDAASEATPFTLLPRLGSTRYLRGFREGRYRDLRSWWAQTELRVPVAGRLSLTAFGALGDVAPGFSDFELGSTKAAGGLGARWRVSDQGAHVRVDVAASRDGLSLYVLLLEAF